MAQVSGEWTVSALSTELKRDRRSIASIIDSGQVEPCKIGKTKKEIKYYRMADIVNAMIEGDQLNLDQERAQKERELTRKAKRENDIEERKLIRLDELTEALTEVAAQAVSILEALPLNIKRLIPGLKAKEVEFIKREIAKSRNAIASIKIKGN